MVYINFEKLIGDSNIFLIFVINTNTKTTQMRKFIQKIQNTIDLNKERRKQKRNIVSKLCYVTWDRLGDWECYMKIPAHWDMEDINRHLDMGRYFTKMNVQWIKPISEFQENKWKNDPEDELHGYYLLKSLDKKPKGKYQALNLK